MPHIQITASSYGTPGEVVAVEDGEVVWAGPIEAIDEAGQPGNRMTPWIDRADA